jgi:hypothetical protein
MLKNSFFDLGHIFIVFGPGAGGNFIAGLLDKLIKKEFTKLDIGIGGSSHTVSKNKHMNGDSLSFGTISDEQVEFASQIERENYYIQRIHEEYADIETPQITWTHDFTNIPIYKKYFKNCRILTITHDSYASRLTSVYMHVTKVFFNPDFIIPIKEPYKSIHFDIWEHTCKSALVPSLGIDIATDIFNKRITDQYAKDIITYISLRAISNYYGLLEYSQGVVSSKPCRYDFALYPNKDNNRLHDIGENYCDYENESDATLTYSYLINNRPTMLLDAIEKILQKTLSVEEENFILTEYRNYRAFQNQDILLEPLKYYRDAEKTALAHIEKLKHHYAAG